MGALDHGAILHIPGLRVPVNINPCFHPTGWPA